MDTKTMSPASSNASPPRASLLGLPAELRVVIYELATAQDSTRFIGTADWQWTITNGRHGALALGDTCSLIRREIKPVLDDKKSPRHSRLELINFTPADMRAWARRYAREFSQIRHISVELWGGCGRNPMLNGHYKFCPFEGTGSKYLNKNCYECPNITSIKSLKSAYGLCKRGFKLDLDTFEMEIFTCEVWAREQLKQYYPERKCMGRALKAMVFDLEVAQEKRLSMRWFNDMFIASLARDCAFPRRPEQDWAMLLRTGLPKKIAAKYGGEYVCEFEGKPESFARELLWGTG